MQSRFPRIHHKSKPLDHRPIHSLSSSLSKYSFTHSSMLSINNVPRGSLIIIDRLTGCRAPAYLQINSDRTLDDLQTTSNYPLSSFHHRGECSGSTLPTPAGEHLCSANILAADAMLCVTERSPPHMEVICTHLRPTISL